MAIVERIFSVDDGEEIYIMCHHHRRHKTESIAKWTLFTKNFTFGLLLLSSSKHTYTHTHTYIYIYIHIYICVCVYIYIYAHTHTHTHTKCRGRKSPAYWPLFCLKEKAFFFHFAIDFLHNNSHLGKVFAINYVVHYEVVIFWRIQNKSDKVNVSCVNVLLGEQFLFPTFSWIKCVSPSKTT